jgi:hypothetical protein
MRSTGIEALSLSVGAKTGDRVLERLRGLDQGVIVAKQPCARLQDVALERGLGEGEIIEGDPVSKLTSIGNI